MLAILEQCDLFAGIDRQDLYAILRCLQLQVLEVKAGEPIFSEGDETCWIGIVLSGEVQLVWTDHLGNPAQVDHVGPAQMFGETYAFSGAQSLPISVIAQQESRVALLDSRRVAQCCTNACKFHKQLIINLLKIVSRQNLMLQQKITITSHRSTREKLLAYLRTQAKIQGSNQFTIPFDRQALADYLEVDRSGLSAEISKLRKEGVLESDKSFFRLL